MDQSPQNPFEPPDSPVGDNGHKAVATTKRDVHLYWRLAFLVVFALLSARFGGSSSSQWGYWLIAVLCLASAVLLWILSPLSRYPLCAVTFYLNGGALFGGISNYVHNPALLQKPLEEQIISWLIPGVPGVLLISCCLYARRLARTLRIEASDRRSQLR